MSRRTVRIASSRLSALLSILLGIVPFIALTGIDIPLIFTHQALVGLVGSASLGLLAVWLGCRWGWLGLGLAIVHLGLDIVYLILSSAQNI